MKQSSHKVVILSVLMLSIGSVGCAQQLYWLGTLGGSFSEAYGVSNCGEVVGESANAASYRRAFRWSRATGMSDLGTLGGSASIAFDISADGQVIVGSANRPSEDRCAFRWENGVMLCVGTLPNYPQSSTAYGISATGSTIVGGASNALGNEAAFVWQSSTIRPLDAFWNYQARAYRVTPDGRLSVGYEQNDSGVARALCWEQGVGAHILPGLGGGYSEARDIDGSGQIIVGYAKDNANRYHAVRWVRQQVEILTGLGGVISDARAVAQNGRVIVGRAIDPVGISHATRWLDPSLPQNLNTVYAHLLPQGAQLTVANDLSPNGRYIVGVGYNPTTGRWEAFLLDTLEPCHTMAGDVNNDGCTDDADLLLILEAFGQRADCWSINVDLNCDGAVDDADLLSVLLDFGQGC